MKNRPSKTVYVSNLSYKRDRNGLIRLFTRYGKIKNIKIIVEPKTNQSRGMAFVEMATLEEAKAAIEGLNGAEIDGRTLKANYAIPQSEELTRKIERTKKAEDEVKPRKRERDLEYKDIQLAKKARRIAKQKANPLVFKKATKKTTKKT